MAQLSSLSGRLPTYGMVVLLYDQAEETENFVNLLLHDETRNYDDTLQSRTRISCSLLSFTRLASRRVPTRLLRGFSIIQELLSIVDALSFIFQVAHYRFEKIAGYCEVFCSIFCPGLLSPVTVPHSPFREQRPQISAGLWPGYEIES